MYTWQFLQKHMYYYKEWNCSLNYLVISILHLSCPIIGKVIICVIIKIKMLTLIQITRGSSMHVYKTKIVYESK